MRRSLAVVLAIVTIAFGFDLATPAPVDAQSNPPLPRLRVNPDCIADPGSTQVRVRGSGFARNGQVRLRFSQYKQIGAASGGIAMTSFAGFGPPDAVTAQGGGIVATVDTDGLGTFDRNVTLTAPVITGALSVVPYGRLWVLAGETVGGGPSTTVLIPSNCDAERVTVQTGCNASNGGQKPASVQVRADGFGANEGAEVSIRRLGGNVLFDQIIATDGQGRIRRDINTNNYPVGDYQVTVEDSDHYAVGWFALPCPTLDIRVNPDCSRIGAPPNRFDVRVVATGFHPNHEAWIIWDGPRAHEFWKADTDKSGRLALTISPYRRGAGSYSLRIRTDDRESAIRQRSVRFEFPCEPAVVSAGQTCGRPALEGDRARRLSFDVNGSGFGPGLVTVTFDADERVKAETFQAEANAQGRFGVTITPRVRPMGVYRIVARQAGGGGVDKIAAIDGQVLSAETSFRVPCRDREPPPLTLDPVCGLTAPRTERAYEITVSGSQYYPNSTIIVSFGQADSFEVVAESDGSFETTIQPSGKNASKVPVRAQQRDTLGAVAATAAARFEVPCPIDPSIEISPDYGQAGYTTTVTGIDFWPGTIVTLTWDRGITAGEPFLVEVGEDGNFEVHVFILPNDWPGERTLTAGTLDDADAFPNVEKTFIVTPGSGVPGGSGDDIVTRR